MKTIMTTLWMLVAIFGAQGQTFVPGGNVSGSWTLTGSPYIIQADITVPLSNTLTIEPGVQVLFYNQMKMDVRGRLLAIGSAADSIRFSVCIPGTNWRGLNFINQTSNGMDSSKVVYCIFTHGRADGSVGTEKVGGGVHCYLSHDVLIRRCRITDNYAEVQGGGIYCDGSKIRIEHTLIAYNQANYGAGMFIYNTPGIVCRNLTVCNNTAGTGGGGIFMHTASGSMHSGILWNNSPNELAFDTGGNITITYSDVMGGYSGTGNINANPLFVNAAQKNYRLSSGSPCINTGDPGFTDPDGTRIDMGAFWHLTGTLIPGGNVSGTWPVSGSPYQVHGEITIPAGQQLIIEPGVSVVFQGHYKFIINGSLLAQGTEADSIHFTAIDPLTGWWGLRFMQTDGQDSSKLRYCDVRYGNAYGQWFEDDGGGIWMWFSSNVGVRNCCFRNNTAADGGSAIGFDQVNAVLENNLIVNNGPVSSIFAYGSSVTCNNLTLHNNGGGGGIQVKYGAVTVNGCILWNSGTVTTESGTADVTYSDIEGGYTGTGNIDADPLFVNSSLMNYHLTENSPCIDAGDPVRVDPDETRADMGAYYYPHSGTYIQAGNLSGTWPVSGSPYQVNGEIIIPAGQQLTIDPGVDVIFLGHYKFIINGSLLAQGTEADSIHFTAEDPVTGWWGLRFMQTSGQDSSKLQYCDIRYGNAYGDWHEHHGGGIWMWFSNNVGVRHCCLRNNSSSDVGSAIALDQSTAVLEGILVVDNVSIVSVYGYGSTMTCNNLTLYNNTGGIHVDYGAVTVNSSILWNSGTVSVNMASADVTYSDIQGGYTGTGNIDADPMFVNPALGDYHLSGGSPCINTGDPSKNDPNGTRMDMGVFYYPGTNVAGGDVSGNWLPSFSPYLVNGDIIIPTGQELTIDPGVEVIFMGHYKLIVHGRLLAFGTASEQIRFTAFNTGEGWQGIRFIDTNLNGQEASGLECCEITYGKATGPNEDAFGGGIFCQNSSNLYLSNCLLENNMAAADGGAICLFSSSIWISGCTIQSCSSASAVFVDASYANFLGCQVINNNCTGIYAYSSSLNIDFCNISSNNGNGLHLNYIQDMRVSMSDISNNAGHGMKCNSITGIIQNNTIRGNSSDGMHFGWSPSPTSQPMDYSTFIQGNTVEYNFHGLNFADPVFGDLTIEFNTVNFNDIPVKILASHVSSLSNNTYNGNLHQYIQVECDAVISDAQWKNEGLPYVLNASLYVEGTDGPDGVTTLEIDPGVVLMLKATEGIYIGLNDKGAFRAVGTSEQRITLTGENISPGAWAGIKFLPNSVDSLCVMQYCDIEFGEYNIWCQYSSPQVAFCESRFSSGSGMIVNDAEGIQINHNVIRDNAGDGIRVQNTNLNVLNDVIIGNGGNAIHLVTPLATRLSQNVISDNHSPLYVASGNMQDVHFTHNDCWLNDTLYAGKVPSGMGILVQHNANGDICDVYYNIFMDPGFVDAGMNDFHLTESSPCINAGNPSLPFDPDSTIADIGMYYHHKPGCAVIVSVKDVPNDQGRQVQVIWDKSPFDETGGGSIEFYSLWREDPVFWEGEKDVLTDMEDVYVKIKGVNSMEPLTGIVLEEGNTLYWENGGTILTYLATIPALGFNQYSYIAPTLKDSSAVSVNYTTFELFAHTLLPGIYYPAVPDSGYSVDNLAPGAPDNLAGVLNGDHVSLNWDACTEPDFQYYALYKSDVPGSFPEIPFATTADTLFNDFEIAFDTLYYRAVAYDFNGNRSDYSNIVMVPINTGITLDLKVYLGGAFTGGAMSTALYAWGFLPLGQPYNANPWNYAGTEAVAAIPSADVTDWVLIELRDAPTAAQATSATRIARQACFLKSNGYLCDLYGSSLVNFNLEVTNNLYVVVWHRNHLQIMTANAVTKTGGIYHYDFTVAAAQAYGGANAQKQVAPGIWAMIGGNGKPDNQVDNSDKLDVWRPQAGSNGYKGGDFNLNGQVNNSDKIDIWKLNTGSGSQVPL